MKKELKMKNEEIEVIQFSNLDHDEIYKGLNPYTNEGVRRLRRYLNSIDAVYYGAPSEDFNVLDGIREAKMLGRSKVVVDNLS